MQIPYILGKSFSSVGCGAIIKNIETDKKAIIVDFDGDITIACTYCKSTKSPSENNYKLFVVENNNDWIVLAEGQHNHYLIDFSDVK